MEELFGTGLIVIVVISIVVAALSFYSRDGLYDQIGKGGLWLDEPELHPGPAPGTAAYDAEAQAEIRQMLEAKSRRMEARGEGPLDIEAEIATLTAPRIDAGAARGDPRAGRSPAAHAGSAAGSPRSTSTPRCSARSSGTAPELV